MATPHNPPAENPIVVEDSSFEAELFWHNHGRKILIAAAVIVVAGLVALALYLSAESRRKAAESAFANANNPADWETVISKYSGSAPAADAALLLAESQRNAKKFDESSATYTNLINRDPKGALAPAASLGLAANLEAQGKLDDAIAAYRNTQSQFSSSYAAPIAALFEARILMLQGKPADARNTLSTLVKAYPSSPTSQYAASMVQVLDRVSPPAATASPTPAPSVSQ